MDRHKPGYYKDYYARSEKAKAKSKRQAERQKEARRKAREQLPRCSICGDPLIKSGLSRDFGFHQKCDPSRYVKLWREVRQK